MPDMTNIAIGLIVVGLLLIRQMQPRPAKETSSIRIVLILRVIGIIEMKSAIGSHTVAAATVALPVVSLLAGAGLGAIRAATVRIWRDQDGSAWRQGTVLTAALWLASLATHLVMDAVIDHSTRIAALGTSSILLYLAVTLGVQREIVRWRAGRHTPGDGSAPRMGSSAHRHGHAEAGVMEATWPTSAAGHAPEAPRPRA